MQVNNITTKNISFSGQRLIKVNLQRIFGDSERKTVHGWFTRMDSSDKSLASELCSLWADTHYGEGILKNFLERLQGKKAGFVSVIAPLKTDTFMIECPCVKKPFRRVKTLAEVSEYDNCLYVDMLQSENKEYIGTRVSGGGTMMMYGVAKLAQKLKKPMVELSSYTAVPWYKKIGFTNNGGGTCILPSCDFESFFRAVEKKYSME